MASPVDYLRPPAPVSADVWRELVNQPSSVQGLAYELRPGVAKFAQGAMVITNAHGMRDRERGVAKVPGTIRIAVLGDSYTFGFGVENDETYPAVLESLLNAEAIDHRYEVLNFGVGGYSTQDEAVVLRAKVLAWKPDLVVVGYVRNDPEIDPVQPLHAYYHRPSWWQYSHLLRKIAEVRNQFEIRRYGRGDYIRYLHTVPRKWQSVNAAFSDMRAATSVPIVVAVFRSASEQYIFDQVKAAAKPLGFVTVAVPDGRTAYSNEETRLPDGHPNALGHQRAALVLRDALVRHGLLPADLPDPARDETVQTARALSSSGPRVVSATLPAR